MSSKLFRCGFVAIVGPTNSGKSTLMNAILEHKVSITSPLPQTTYHGVRGILNRPDYQIIFTDTPGFQRYPQAIPRLLNKIADKHAGEGDCLLWVFDASNSHVLDQIKQLSQKAEQHNKKDATFCVLNKIDLLPKLSLLPLIEKINETKLFSEIIPVSARKKNGMDRLVSVALSHIPEGPAFFSLTEFTDRPKDFLVSEYIREKVYLGTRAEVPYAVRIEVEPLQPDQTARVPTLFAKIHVDSDSKKGILIGKGGEKLKRIGTTARKDIEDLLGHQICLKLQVCVEANWKEDTRLLHRYLEIE